MILSMVVVMDDLWAERFNNALTEISESLESASRPSVLYKPRLFLDGDRWCALLGENPQVGVVGFGKSPAVACTAFDAAWGTCTDTTCGLQYYCSKCRKAAKVEEALQDG